jgi:hypothetical protein
LHVGGFTPSTAATRCFTAAMSSAQETSLTVRTPVLVRADLEREHGNAASLLAAPAFRIDGLGAAGRM